MAPMLSQKSQSIIGDLLSLQFFRFLLHAFSGSVIECVPIQNCVQCILSGWNVGAAGQGKDEKTFTFAHILFSVCKDKQIP